MQKNTREAAICLLINICLALFPTRLLADLLEEEPIVDTPKKSSTPAEPPTHPVTDSNKKADLDRKKDQGNSAPAAAGPSKKKKDTADSRAKVSQGNRNAPVRLRSKGFKGSRDQGFVDLEKDVVISQDDLKIEAAQARVYFKKDSQEVDKVHAKGNVSITKKDANSGTDVRARGNEVLFFNGERKVVFQGNAKFWRGKDLIQGKRIIYNLQSGWAEAEEIDGVLMPEDEN